MADNRSNIAEISIQNFKFFPKNEKPLKLDGNNALLYGENGAGKSSIYWALYTLLECANKEDEEEIKKYFTPTHKERLTNIHIKAGSPSWVDPYVKVKLVDGTEYEISLGEFDINKNEEAQENNFSSDFINYRVLFRLYDFAHSDDIDIFPLFEREVLPYVKFDPIKYWYKKKDGTITDLETQSGNRILQFVRQGPQKNIPNTQQKLRYPIRKEQQFGDYANVVKGFRASLEDLIRFINTEGNPILKDELGYDITFNLKVDNKRFLKLNQIDYYKEPFLLTEQRFIPPLFNIWLTIPEYEGETNAVEKPHSFLNEAKLTAVGLAIRLAVLKYRLFNNERTAKEADGENLKKNAKLRMLCLDDLLISLDMSNRQKVMDLLLEKYQSQYQIIVLTHDRSFYEVAKSKIKNLGFENKWIFYEMYVDESKVYEDNTIAPIKPIIFRSPSKIKKAEEFISIHDYPAAGIYLRTECEELLDNLYPDFFKVETKANHEGRQETKALNLNDKILKLKEFCEKENINYLPIKDLKVYKDCFLNVVAHNDKTSPLYKAELIAVLNSLKELKKIKRSRYIVKSNKDLLFDLSNTDGNTFHCSIRLKGNLTLLEVDGEAPRISYYNQCEVRKTVIDGNENTELFSENSFLEFYKRKCIDLLIEPSHDLFQLLRYQGNPIQTKLDELLNPPA